MAKPVDLQVVHDAEQMRVLREAGTWKVLSRYVESLRDEALTHMLDPRQEDQIMHHWRGVYAAAVRVLGLPDEVIAYEKTLRS